MAGVCLGLKYYRGTSGASKGRGFGSRETLHPSEMLQLHGAHSIMNVASLVLNHQHHERFCQSLLEYPEISAHIQ